jgi:hypothetical protein
MARKSASLPTHSQQSVYFTNKVLWESARIQSEMNELSISEFVQLAVEHFISSESKSTIITRYKLFKDI